MIGRILSLLRAFPPREPTKKKFVTQMIAWSCKFGEYPNGDPELHHAAGTLFAEGTRPASGFMKRIASTAKLIMFLFL